MYIDWICNVYMYNSIKAYTERKYIRIDNKGSIDIRIDNINW